MSEKYLSEPPWRALATKFKVKDLGLQKALLEYGRINPEKDPSAAVVALTQIPDVALRIKKANPTLKEVVTYLDAVACEAANKKKELAIKPKAGLQDQEQEEEEEIKVRLMNSLKKVRAAAGKESIAFVACVA